MANDTSNTDIINCSFSINPTINDLNYTHHQDVPSMTWTISHLLNKFPSVTVVTSAGDRVEANVHYVNKRKLQIFFTAPFAGTAYLN